MSGFDANQMLDERLKKIRKYLIYSAFLLLFFMHASVGLFLAHENLPNDIHIPWRIADSWVGTIGPSGRAIQLKEIGWDSPWFIRLWSPIFVISCFGLYLAGRKLKIRAWGPRCFMIYWAIDLLSPVTLSPLRYIDGPQVVSVDEAEYAVAQGVQLGNFELGTYVKSQIAYTKGETALARRLAISIKNEAEIASPMEAGWRLKYLRGQDDFASQACAGKIWCIPQKSLTHFRYALCSLVVVALFWVGFLIFLMFTTFQRREFIKTLQIETGSQHRLRKVSSL